MKEVISQLGWQGNDTSGSCLAIVLEGVTFSGTYMGCVSGTLSSKGRKRSFLLCWLSEPAVSPGSPSKPWSSPASSSPSCR